MEKFNSKYGMYLLSMEVGFPEDASFDKESIPGQFDINESYIEKELSKILPKNILSGGYICTVCETYLDNYPKSMCSLCYEHDVESLDNPDYDWFDIEHLNKRMRNLDFIFVTSSETKCELTEDDFAKLENIKISRFSKINPFEAAVEAQYTIKFDGTKFIFTDEDDCEVKNWLYEK